MRMTKKIVRVCVIIDQPISCYWFLSMPPGFLMFSGGIQIDQRHEMGFKKKKKLEIERFCRTT